MGQTQHLGGWVLKENSSHNGEIADVMYDVLSDETWQTNASACMMMQVAVPLLRE